MAREFVQGIPVGEVDWKPIGEVMEGVKAARTSGGTLACLLSHDAETGARTLLVKLAPGWSSAAPESHSVTQENFILEGEVTTDLDSNPLTLTAGMYRCIPAGQVHGPGRTETGCIMLQMDSGPIDMIYHEPTHAATGDAS
jgi:mannose-6-phosphate isomerase-like protein (cupin superfamily)